MNDKHKAAMVYAYGVGYEIGEIKIEAVKYGWDAALTAVNCMIGGLLPVSTDTVYAQHRMVVLTEVAERVQGFYYDGAISPSLRALITNEEQKS